MDKAKLLKQIDEILQEARANVVDSGGEFSQYAEGVDAAVRDAHEAIDEARARIASLLADDEART